MSNTLHAVRATLVALGLAASPSMALAYAPRVACNKTEISTALRDVGSVSSAETIWDLSLPTHCKVRGKVGAIKPGITPVEANYNIGFELRMPNVWNGRFFFQGGAGTDGFVSKAVGGLLGSTEGNALSRGYAVVTTDAGHSALSAWADNLGEPYGAMTSFGQDFEQRVDYGYRALDLVTKAAKKSINYYYGLEAQKSFFVGCSNGGRQALMVAKRYAAQFDGVLAGAPALNIAKQVFQAVQDAKEMAAFSDYPGNGLTSAEMTTVAQKVLAACDGLDGANDGLVSDPLACQSTFDPNSLRCSLFNTKCLANAKVDALIRMIAGVKTRDNRQIYAGWLWDPGIGANQTFSSWRTWRLESALGILSGEPFSLMTVLSGGALANMVRSPAELNAPGTARESWNYLKGYDIDSGYANLTQTAPGFPISAHDLYDVPDPTHLSDFRARSGKLIVFTGSADGTVSAKDVINWYDGLRAEDAKIGVNTANYARLYVVPGMGHCGGGFALDKFNLFDVLDGWVTRAEAPNWNSPPVASLSSGNKDAPSDWDKRTRPLCEYGHPLKYRGWWYDQTPASSFYCL